MATHLASPSLGTALQVSCHDRVSVPDGRTGQVIGFYRREEESVLVSFSSGVPAEFLTRTVERIR